MSPVATESAPPKVQLLEIALGALNPSPLNPRKTFNDDALADLAASIREHGVIEPLLVRATSIGVGYEIVAGERRYRAAKLAGLKTVPCLDRAISDTELIEKALIENHQRADVHPLEEAVALQALLDRDSAYTIAGLAAKLGVSKSWVYGRLKLLRMCESAQEAYRTHSITAEHADLLATVPSHQQEAALIACFSQLLYNCTTVDQPDGDQEIPDTVAAAVAQQRWDLLVGCLDSSANLRRWIAGHTVVDIADDAVQEAIIGLHDALEDAAAEQASVIQVSVDPNLNEAQAKALGVIRRPRWIEINEAGDNVPNRVSTDRCEYIKDAVITHPVDAKENRLVTICMKRSCEVHRPAPKNAKSGSPKQSDRDLKAEERRLKAEADAKERDRVWVEEQRPKYLAALAALVAKKKALTPEVVRMVVEPWRIADIEAFYGVALTAKTALTVVILSAAPVGDWQTKRESSSLLDFGKDWGLTPAAWEKAEKTAAKSTPAKTTKKGRR